MFFKKRITTESLLADFAPIKRKLRLQSVSVQIIQFEHEAPSIIFKFLTSCGNSRQHIMRLEHYSKRFLWDGMQAAYIGEIT